jgi:hypothetical protein
MFVAHARRCVPLPFKMPISSPELFSVGAEKVVCVYICMHM